MKKLLPIIFILLSCSLAFAAEPIQLARMSPVMIACSEGTAVVVTDELTTDYDTEELIVTEWSTAVTVTDITAGELSKLLFIRDVSEDDMVGHALVAFIEIKYQAKINASMDY